jgi:hypothetical protein
MNKSLLFIFSLFISVSLNAQTLSVTVSPSVGVPGETTTLTMTYNTDEATDIIYYALVKKNSDGSWAATVAEGNINGDGNSPLTTGTNTTVTATLDIPSSQTLSADLQNGEFYEFKIEVQTSGWQWQTDDAGFYDPYTISTTASVAGAEKLPATVYPNPTKGVLHLATSVSFDAYKVISLTGKVVEERSHTGLQSIDVSHLNKGIYFLQIDAHKPVKFVKQ